MSSLAEAQDGPEETGLPSPDAESSTPLEIPPRKRGRHLFLRGLQRISSSPSLAPTGRPRASSNPYDMKSSFSCVSLATGASASGSQPGLRSPLQPSPASSSASGLSAGASSSTLLDAEGLMAVRKLDNSTPSSLSTTSTLPVELMHTRTRANSAPRKRALPLWDHLPQEIRLHILSYLAPKELVRASRVCKLFHSSCFDGQLWTSLDASEFYREIPSESLASIILAAGPFVKDLNLRGCVQVERNKRVEVMATACRNLIQATLEGCGNIPRNSLHTLLQCNQKLAVLNLTGLTAVTNTSCEVVAKSCPLLEVFNVSWCTRMDARGIKAVLEGCPRLRDLCAGEVRSFDNIGVAEAIFAARNLERLVLSGCSDLNDRALTTMSQGTNPEIDILTGLPDVPPRKLRHLDLSRCTGLTSRGVRSLGHLVPDLEGLQLSGCPALTDAALEPILASTPRLTHLELEELSLLTNNLLSEHLAKAPCAPQLEHLSLSYCEHLGDAGLLPVMKNCVSLRNVDMDNTRISDLVLAEAAMMASNRTQRSKSAKVTPKVGLHMVVYDCPNVTWTGIREVLFRNTQIRHTGGQPTYPTEIISLKCFYGFQMTVDEHMKRVLRSDFAAAGRLERKWADYMQANEEAGVAGTGARRRRRRAREAQQLHTHEENGGADANAPRRRALTVGACVVM